jgi:ribosome maturation factor RimP
MVPSRVKYVKKERNVLIGNYSKLIFFIYGLVGNMFQFSTVVRNDFCCIFASCLRRIRDQGTLVPCFFAMISELHIRTLAEQALEGTDAFLVDVHVTPMNKIIVLLDRDGGVGINQCVAVSRFIEKSLDREAEDFELEVSSAGLDQPFKVLRQYQKNIGREVDVKLADGKKIKGNLVSADESGITVQQSVKERIEGRKAKQTVEKTLTFTFPEIKETKVVIKF